MRLWVLFSQGCRVGWLLSFYELKILAEISSQEWQKAPCLQSYASTRQAQCLQSSWSWSQIKFRWVTIARFIVYRAWLDTEFEGTAPERSCVYLWQPCQIFRTVTHIWRLKIVEHWMFMLFHVLMSVQCMINMDNIDNISYWPATILMSPSGAWQWQ